MRFLPLALLALVCVSPHAMAAQNIAPQIRADHPYLGKWMWAYNGCNEVYENRSNGTSKITSGEEVGESAFTISDEPERSGFYSVTDTVTNSNGKTGCDGTSGGTPVGDVAAFYVFIRPSNEEMLICQDESINQCMGPLKRIVNKP